MNSIILGNEARRGTHNGLGWQIAWWSFFLICALYGGYALYVGMTELLAYQGLAASLKPRGIPLIFVLHALTGSVVLISAALQLNPSLLKRHKLHRIIGRIYVGTVWLSSAAGLWSARFFDVGIVAQIIFALVAVLWFGATTAALLAIRQRKVAAHREWMLRSVALSCFFLTFEFWKAGMASTSLPESIGYPLAVFASGSVNLLIAEWWIGRTRRSAL
ncbi:MAG: DUF2306 domain-containing protein [Caldilineaceae bacterium]